MGWPANVVEFGVGVGEYDYGERGFDCVDPVDDIEEKLGDESEVAAAAVAAYDDLNLVDYRADDAGVDVSQCSVGSNPPGSMSSPADDLSVEDAYDRVAVDQCV